jgi:hypothetical protein
MDTRTKSKQIWRKQVAKLGQLCQLNYDILLSRRKRSGEVTDSSNYIISGVIYIYDSLMPYLKGFKNQQYCITFYFEKILMKCKKHRCKEYDINSGKITNDTEVKYVLREFETITSSNHVLQT